MLIEAAVDTVAAADRAVREGAGRLEVCNALDVGGLTPSRELLRKCLALRVPCIAMARPRSGGFHNSEREIAQIVADAENLLAAGAHGVVFGCLNDDATINTDATRRIVQLAGDADTVFHRAFDETPDALAALDTLIACSVTRVLTSGHASTASDGADEIAALIAHAAGRIAILPGGSVRGPNARELVTRTGAMQLHARAATPGVISDILGALL